MAYVITEPCIGTKDNSCVEVCPVDCIHPTPDEPGYEAAEMLFIDPEECIDCDACVEACPVDAIYPEDMVPHDWQKYIEINAAHFQESRVDRRAASVPLIAVHAAGGLDLGRRAGRDLRRRPRRLGDPRAGPAGRLLPRPRPLLRGRRQRRPAGRARRPGRSCSTTTPGTGC